MLTSSGMVVVVVAFSSLARILEEWSTMHSPPTLLLLFCFEVDISSRTPVSLVRPGSVLSGSVS